MKKFIGCFLLMALLPAAFMAGCGSKKTPTSPAGSSGPAAVSLGTAGTYSILAYSGITAASSTSICGDVGIYPATGSAITGPFFQNTGCSGITYTGASSSGPASQAQVDLISAYNAVTALTGATTLATVVDLGGQTLHPGLYKEPTTLAIGAGSGILTLDAQNVANAVFIFQVGTALNAAGSSQVKLINGAQAANVFWQVGSSCTLNTGAIFAGIIMAYDDITFDSSATLQGRALAIGALHGSDGIVSFAGTNEITNP